MSELTFEEAVKEYSDEQLRSASAVNSVVDMYKWSILNEELGRREKQRAEMGFLSGYHTDDGLKTQWDVEKLKKFLSNTKEKLLVLTLPNGRAAYIQLEEYRDLLLKSEGPCVME
jgi:hypothetical protein